MTRRLLVPQRSQLLLPIVDVLGSIVLVFFPIWSVLVFFEYAAVSDWIKLAFFVSAALNTLGLLLAVRHQKPIFTGTFFFSFVFFVLAPAQQIRFGFDPLYADSDILSRAVILCLLYALVCFCGSLVGPKSYLAYRQPNNRSSTEISNQSVVLLFVASVMALVAGFTSYGDAIISNRADAGSVITQKYDQAFALIIFGFICPFAFYSTMIGLWISWQSRHRGWSLSFGVAFIGALLLNNPVILPRYQFAAFIFAFVFFFVGRMRCRLLVFALAVGLLAAPFFHVFRYATSTIEVNELSRFLVSMDYDAFSLLCHTVLHVANHGVDWGMNFVSGVLFFVPRSVWPAKYEITPYYLMDTIRLYRSLWYFNLSEPLVAEGYFAFGTFGSIAVGIVLVAFINLVESMTGSNRLTILYVFSCALPVLLFMLLRGSFMVGMSVLTGHFFAVAIGFFILRLGTKQKVAVRLSSLGRRNRSGLPPVLRTPS